MTATTKQWNMYQVTKALLEPEQQNVLTAIEGYMACTEPGVTIAEFDIFSDHVSDWRGQDYSPAANHRFLAELGRVNIGAPDGLIAQNLFDRVRLYCGGHGVWRLAIRLSDYFSEVIGAYIRDRKGA